MGKIVVNYLCEVKSMNTEQELKEWRRIGKLTAQAMKDITQK